MTLLDFRTDSADTDTELDLELDTRITEADLFATRAPSTLRRTSRTISDVSAIVDGTTARLRYTTDAPVVEILITPYRPTLIDGVWVEWVLEAVDATDFAAGGGTVDYFHRTLRPGIDYHYIITAQGAGGELPTQVIGTFSTPRMALAA